MMQQSSTERKIYTNKHQKKISSKQANFTPQKGKKEQTKPKIRKRKER